jgi:hypothetical protein
VNFHILMTNENHVQIAQRVFLDFVLQRSPYFEGKQSEVDTEFIEVTRTKQDFEKNLTLCLTSQENSGSFLL